MNEYIEKTRQLSPNTEEIIYSAFEKHLFEGDNKKRNIALVAHDSRKDELLEWVSFNKEVLSKQNLFATGTTGSLIKNLVSVPNSENYDESVNGEKPFEQNTTCLLSGPLGGDSQISALIAEGKIDMLIFFCDNLIVQGHQNDVGALSRLASLYNIAYATNRTTADMLLTSPLFNDESYNRIVPKAIENYKKRTLILNKK